IPDPDFAGTGAYGIAPDGSFAVGFADNRGGVRWVGDTPMPVQIPNFAYGIAVSLDRSTIVGGGRLNNGPYWTALRWTQNEGTVSLGVLLGGQLVSSASAVSGDGHVVVGLSGSLGGGQHGYEAFRWTAQTGMVGLGDLPGGAFHSEARGVSAD